MARAVVVGVDGSADSLRAVDWAAETAGCLGRPLHVVHAVSGHSPHAYREADEADRLLRVAEARARAGRTADEVTTATVYSDPDTALLNAAGDAFTLVVGARGNGDMKELLVGSVGLAVAARAPCPVVVVRDTSMATAIRGARLLLGVEDTSAGGGAVRFAFALAGACGGVIDAVSAWHRTPRTKISAVLDLPRHPELAAQHAEEDLRAALAEERTRHAAVEVHTRVAEGPARDVLLKASETADLLVVGAEARPSRTGLYLGRVNHALLHHVRCPVAIVPGDR
ncbi:universal stress protein [Streptomyces solincola]|uniref:Universal stress protein n=1 Tax=Streptomyces solincola TaxID=2100817 RepID=A0A2S9Q298_9ACTN|nr:universal stress protein [Streptomyces solincola]PRH80758.1 universal stress protein [Streptomyces solincola]